MIRSAGILLPISSLPSPYGIGTMGKAAYDFITPMKIIVKITIIIKF